MYICIYMYALVDLLSFCLLSFIYNMFSFFRKSIDVNGFTCY